MSLTSNGSERRCIVIVSKKNNWRPTADQPEVPDCLDYAARPYLKKVGDRVTIHEQSPTFPLLLRYLAGEDPEKSEIERAAGNLANLLTNKYGFMKELQIACGRMRRKGLDNPSAPTILAKHVFRIIQERVNA